MNIKKGLLDTARIMALALFCGSILVFIVTIGGFLPLIVYAASDWQPTTSVYMFYVVCWAYVIAVMITRDRG